MREILTELEASDPEHPDTWLTHESGWTFSVAENGVAVWENLELDTGPRYREGVTQDEALRLWLLLSKGELQEIECEDWKDGEGPPISQKSWRSVSGNLRTLYSRFIGSSTTAWEPRIVPNAAGGRIARVEL